MQQTPLDAVNNPLGSTRPPLDALFTPRNVAVIGATDKAGSVGRTILWNLISSPFGGAVFPVNPKRPSVLGIKAYPSIGEVPDEVDLAVIVTPSPSVPGLIGECVEKKVKGAIVISAGFKETGPEGVELERRVLEQVRPDWTFVTLPDIGHVPQLEAPDEVAHHLVEWAKSRVLSND